MVADKQTIKKWNMELELHPDLEVPEASHLKKVPVREVTLTFGMKRNVVPQVGENWLMAFELVNDLISGRFKSSVIEPSSIIKVVQKVKPLHGKGLHKDKQVDLLVEKQQSIRNSMMILEKSSAKTKSRFDNLNRSLEMSLSPDMQFYDSRSMAQSTKILNKYQMLKMVDEQEQLLKSELK